MEVSELKSKRLKSLWLKASATWGGGIFAGGLHDWSFGGRIPVHLYPLIGVKFKERRRKLQSKEEAREEFKCF
jgi:hypothetical protein